MRAPVALLALDEVGRFALCAGSGLGALGLAPGQLVGLSVYDVYRDDPAALDRFHRARAGEEVTTLVETGGAVIEMRWAPSRAGVQGGAGGGVVVVGIDITARRRAEEALRHQALHDPLTGLPNRALLSDRLEAGVRGAARHRTPLALLLIDLDRFKDINDTLGHHHGDLLLRQVGARMVALLRATDTVARLGGDEFAVVLPGADSATGTVVAAKIAAALGAPFTVEGRPDEFIPLAERIGVSASLTRWALDTTLAQCRAWQRAGRALSVSVNLSVRDLQDAGLPDMVAELLVAHSVTPADLRLEVTESMLGADMACAGDVLARLAALGVRVAVDDFGAGYSSLAYLARLPVDELKIDRSFVQRLVVGAAEATIVASTIGLGHSLGLRVVAEGVEDAAAWARLTELGCDAAQGYYIGRPLPAADLGRWLAAWRAGKHRSTALVDARVSS